MLGRSLSIWRKVMNACREDASPCRETPGLLFEPRTFWLPTAQMCSHRAQSTHKKYIRLLNTNPMMSNRNLTMDLHWVIQQDSDPPEHN